MSHFNSSQGALGAPTYQRLAPPVNISQRNIASVRFAFLDSPLKRTLSKPQMRLRVGNECSTFHESGFGAQGALLTWESAVAEQTGLTVVTQLQAVVFIDRCDADTVNQATGAIYANVRLHAKVPLPRLASRVHLRITDFVLILRRAGRCKDSGIHNTAFAIARFE